MEKWVRKYFSALSVRRVLVKDMVKRRTLILIQNDVELRGLCDVLVRERTCRKEHSGRGMLEQGPVPLGADLQH